jgi:hypothetical protein
VSPSPDGKATGHELENLARSKQSVTSIGLSVEKYSANNCSQVRIGDSTLVDSCHGWEVTDCGSLAFFRGIGVRQDTGIIVFYNSGQNLADVSVALNNAISEKFPNDEILHRTFTESTCDANGISIMVRGSKIKKHSVGAADALTATIKVNDSGKIAVEGIR